MNKKIAEILLTVPITQFLGILIFYGGVLRKTMDDMDARSFQTFLGSIIRHSPSSPLMIFITNATFIFMIPYWIIYGFGNWWFTAGLILGFITSSIAKVIKLPVYKEIAKLEKDDISQLNKMRAKFQRTNVLQAIFTFIAVALMVMGLIW